MEIAIIGLSCRLPGGTNPDAFAERLAKGAPALCTVPADRWSAEAWTDPELLEPGRTVSSVGGFLGDLRRGDPGFFGWSDYEAARTDPRRQLLAELAWQALEDAGLVDVEGTPGALVVGIGLAEHLERSVARGELSPWLPASAPNVVVNAVSGALGLRGLSLGVDMGCASALAAVHLAARAVASGEAPWALAGGVHAILAPSGSIVLSHAGLLSPSGRCRPFSGQADGWTRGEGGALVVLAPLQAARKAGHRVLAVLEGSALTHSGEADLSASVSGIARALRAALQDAGRKPEDIGAVEAHGVGTPAGDRAEAKALAEVFAEVPEVWVGAGKAWTGHLEWAAGAAALVKAVQGMRRGELPGQPDTAELPAPLMWTTTTRPWPEVPRRTLIQGFALGGSHAALVVAAGDEEPEPSSGPVVWEVGARTLDDLPRVAEAHASWLEGRDLPVPPRRTRLPARVAVAGRTGSELALALREAEGRSVELPRVGLLFTGQGSQRPGMGEGIDDPVFRAAHEEVDRLIAAHLGRSVRGLGEEVHDTRYAQPALFALEWALWQMWRARGIRPVGAVGHSLGELTALAAAGAWSLEDAVAVVVARGAAMAEAPRGGAMAAVLAPEEVVREALVGGVEIAAVNGAENVVICGPEALVVAACEALEEDFWGTVPLTVSHAFHSAAMESALPAVRRAAGSVVAREPAFPVLGNRTARPLGPPSADSLAEQVRGTVRFADALGALEADLLLELGPGGTLVRLARRAGREAVASLDPEDEPLGLARATAALITAGVELPLPGARPAPGPAHPFRRDPLAAAASGEPLAAAEAVVGRTLDPDRGWMEQGLGSLELVAVAQQLSAARGEPVPPELLFEHPTPARLAAFLAGERRAGPVASPVAPAPCPSAAPVSLVGAGVRLPGGIDGLDRLWETVDGGRIVAGLAPVDRGIAVAGGFLDDVEAFDAARFDLDPAEAAHLDPHHRVLLEVASEALQHAGLEGEARRGLRTGVFVAQNGAEWAVEGAGDHLPGAVGALPSSAAGRVAWHLDLDGPALTVDTACSGSLVAVHLAVQALRSGECDVALAGGVSLQLRPDAGEVLVEAGALASDGRSRAFEPEAHGYGRSEGCAVVVLRRAVDAKAAGDPELARLLGCAVGHDGRSSGFVAPHGPAQEAVIRRALAAAGVEPADVALVEAHGTGTALGDPIEARALSRVFPDGVDVLASKRSLGHCEAAAGVTGLLLVAEAVRRGRRPGQPVRRQLADSVRGLPLRFPVGGAPWPGERPRIAGVSSFGMTGTNAHALVGPPAPRQRPPGPHRLVLSARSESAVRAMARRAAAWLREGADPAGMCAAAAGRALHPWRIAATGSDGAALADALEEAAVDRCSVPDPPLDVPRAHLPPEPWSRGGLPGGLDPARPLEEQGVDSLAALAIRQGRGEPVPVGSREARLVGDGEPGLVLALPPGVPEESVAALARSVGTALWVVPVPVGEVDPEGLLPHLDRAPVLAGWSLGGHVAARAARLRAPAALVVVDASPHPESLDEATTLWLFAGSVGLRAGQDAALDVARAKRLGRRRALRAILEAGIEAGLLPPDQEEQAFDRVYRRFSIGLHRSVRPSEPWTGPTWSAVARQGPLGVDGARWGPRCTVTEIPGDHYSLWLHGVDELADVVRQAVEEVSWARP